MIVAQAQSDGSPRPLQKDDFSERLSKLIPPESLVFYVAITGGIALAVDAQKISAETARWLQFLAYLAGGLGTLLILRAVVMKDPQTKQRTNAPPSLKQNLITIAAFAIWALAIGSPLACFGCQDTRWVGAIAAPLVTFTLACIP